MKILAFLLFVSGALLAGEPSNDNVSVEDLSQALADAHAKAINGDFQSCNDIWRLGRFIDKHEIFKKKYPLEKRLDLLMLAAEKENTEANFELFKYLSCEKKRPFSETRKWLEFAHRNGNNKASVILALILGIDKKKSGEALNVIKLAELRIPQDVGGKDQFAENKLSKEDFDLLRTVIQEGNTASLDKKIGVAEGELKDSVEIWRRGNRK